MNIPLSNQNQQSGEMNNGNKNKMVLKEMLTVSHEWSDTLYSSHFNKYTYGKMFSIKLIHMKKIYVLCLVMIFLQ